MNCNHLVILHRTSQLATIKDAIEEAGAVAVAIGVDIDINYQPTNSYHKKNYSFS
ncbi:MAG: hypothetical protein M3Y25_03555 [Thermoproteota archaeon]|nr:hypothetical protein [Thermoproteota archaeon]